MKLCQDTMRVLVEALREGYIERERAAAADNKANARGRLTPSQRQLLATVRDSEPTGYVPVGQLERECLNRLKARGLVISMQRGRRLIWRLTDAGRTRADE